MGVTQTLCGLRCQEIFKWDENLLGSKERPVVPQNQKFLNITRPEIRGQHKILAIKQMRMA